MWCIIVLYTRSSDAKHKNSTHNITTTAQQHNNTTAHNTYLLTDAAPDLIGSLFTSFLVLLVRDNLGCVLDSEAIPTAAVAEVVAVGSARSVQIESA